jgi:hypothetical protein
VTLTEFARRVNSVNVTETLTPDIQDKASRLCL